MKVIKPKNQKHWLELRTQDVTSTECSALFNCNPYMTKFELWHRKKNDEYLEMVESERMKWGTRLEDAIARGIAEDNGWLVEPFKDYGRLEDLRAGSSFDYQFYNEKADERGLLEIKNVDGLQFKEKWLIEDGEVIEAPPHIEIQVQHQMMVSGANLVYIGALIGGNQVALIRREADHGIINKIQVMVKLFWDSIANDAPPPIDFERDADFINELYQASDSDKVLDGNTELELLAKKYKEFAKARDEFDKKRKATKAKILTMIGDAGAVKGDTFSISAKMRKAVQYEVKKEAYRDFRVFIKKGKSDEV